MRLLLVIPALGPVYGGPSKIAPALASALGRRRHAVDLVTTDADGAARLDVPPGWIQGDRYRVRYFPRLSRSEYKVSLSLIGWLWRHVRDYDAVHVTSNFNFPVLACALVCRLRGTPYIIAPQGMLEPWALGYKAGKKKFYLSLVEAPLVLRGARFIQALNGNEAANIEALRLGPRVVVLANGIDAADMRDPSPADAGLFLDHFPAARGKTILLFLHRVDPKKGLGMLASAYAAVRARFPETHLVVAGPPTAGYEDTARGYFRDAGVKDAVTFTGLLDGALKRGALTAASVFVAPSHSEGFSMAVLEAMAAGLPCVITEGCNFPEAAQAGAARVVPVASEPFAAALADVLADPAAGRAMGERARSLVAGKYTWDRVAAEATEIFAAAARPDRAGPLA